MYVCMYVCMSCLGILCAVGSVLKVRHTHMAASLLSAGMAGCDYDGSTCKLTSTVKDNRLYRGWIWSGDQGIICFPPSSRALAVRSAPRTLYIYRSFVPRPHHAREERVWGHWHRFLVVKAHTIICIGLYWSTCGRVKVHKTKKTLRCPQSISSCAWWGLGMRLHLPLVRLGVRLCT